MYTQRALPVERGLDDGLFRLVCNIKTTNLLTSHDFTRLYHSRVFVQVKIVLSCRTESNQTLAYIIPSPSLYSSPFLSHARLHKTKLHTLPLLSSPLYDMTSPYNIVTEPRFPVPSPTAIPEQTRSTHPQRPRFPCPFCRDTIPPLAGALSCQPRV
jgi:hypothetical protein